MYSLFSNNSLNFSCWSTPLQVAHRFNLTVQPMLEISQVSRRVKLVENQFTSPIYRTRPKKYINPLTTNETSNPISPVTRARSPTNHTWFIQGITTPKDNTLDNPAALLMEGVLGYPMLFCRIMKNRFCGSRYVRLGWWRCRLLSSIRLIRESWLWLYKIGARRRLRWVQCCFIPKEKESNQIKSNQVLNLHLHRCCYHRRHISWYRNQNRDKRL